MRCQVALFNVKPGPPTSPQNVPLECTFWQIHSLQFGFLNVWCLAKCMWGTLGGISPERVPTMHCFLATTGELQAWLGPIAGALAQLWGAQASSDLWLRLTLQLGGALASHGFRAMA